MCKSVPSNASSLQQEAVQGWRQKGAEGIQKMHAMVRIMQTDEAPSVHLFREWDEQYSRDFMRSA